MPFTIAHPLFVAPFFPVRRVLPVSALAIGSMVPDWPLYFSWGPNYVQSHSMWGIPAVCLPMGVVLFLAYEFLLKEPLIELFPKSLRERMTRQRLPTFDGSLLFWLGVGLAVMIGAASHVFIDSFTHQNRWGTNHLPWLNNAAFIIGGRNVPTFKLLQYGGSAIGIPLLLALFGLWIQRRPVIGEACARSTPWRLACCGFLILSIVVGIVTFFTRHDVAGWPMIVSATLRGAVGGGCAGLVVHGLAYRLPYTITSRTGSPAMTKGRSLRS